MRCPLSREVVLVRKNKPKWQAGRLNGIGGAIEGGESPYQAMVREWHEETGHNEVGWSHFATLAFPGGRVHFFSASVDRMPAFPAKNDIGEAIEIHNYESVVRSDDVIDNLKWLMPLAFDDPQAQFVWCGDNDNAIARVQVAA